MKNYKHELLKDDICKTLEQPAQQEPVAVYGHCPECGAKGVMRERRPNGNDKCANGHTYLSSVAQLKTPKKPLPGTVAHRLLQTVERLNFNENQAARYFGVPVFTLRKWLNGELEPSASMATFIEFMEIMENMDPEIENILKNP
ncbi:hypothetical protein UFOVP352_42 [uncultured Caudovirales phage]|uniref:HTH_XRE domain containing protein n=1 Tax=uncultured Caudovirales phage TaxID=2100421 RepID=A0A6J5M3X0_9CAUD|nr:hypothetical protein UFOVP352_42 [uncultured Caudovirales phage]CAB4218434.1 hypothetical protein UFOVP1607_20 [uncultured Caudovirales phage]